MYPTRFDRIRYWIAHHILGITSPYFVVAAIYYSPLLPAIENIYNKRHECSFSVKFSETSTERFNVEITIQEGEKR